MPSQAAFRLLFHTAGASGIPEEPADRIMRQIGTLLDGKNLADKLNCLAREIGAAEIPGKITGEVFEALIARNILPDDLSGKQFSPDTEFLLKKALLLFAELKKIPEKIPAEAKDTILPGALQLFSQLPDYEGNIE